MPSQRLRIARYLNASCWMCQAKSGWPKWQKYHALRGDTALEPKFYVNKRLALPRAASDFSPPEGAEGETHAWPRSRLIAGFRGGGGERPTRGRAVERHAVPRAPLSPLEDQLNTPLARCTSVHLDRDAADGSLRARGWRTLCERLIVIPWDARAAGAAKILLACLPQALRIRCIL